MLHLLTEIRKGAAFDEISAQDKLSSKGAYTNHVDQAGGRGGFQIVHVSPQGGRGG